MCGGPVAGGQIEVRITTGACGAIGLGAAEELCRALEEAVGATPLPAPKGSPETILLALGSAGAISAAVEVFKLWLSRERSRRLVVTWRVGEQEARIELAGDDISNAAARDVLIAALENTRHRRNE